MAQQTQQSRGPGHPHDGMTPHDFAHWLKGFAAGVGGSLQDAQWALVCEQLGRVGSPTSALFGSQLTRPGQVYSDLKAIAQAEHL